jgi:hypothetical protein
MDSRVPTEAMNTLRENQNEKLNMHEELKKEVEKVRTYELETRTQQQMNTISTLKTSNHTATFSKT